MNIRDSYPTMPKPERFDPTRTRVEKMTMFPPLASDAENLLGYVRSGGCTPGCGVCCQAFVVPINVEGLEHDDFERVNGVGQIVLPVSEVVRGKAGMEDWEHWLNLHEVYLFQSPGGLLTAEIPVKANSPLPVGFDAWVAWLEKHGITVLRREEQQLLAYVPITCIEMKDGLCTISGTPAQPRMCARYPEHPMDVQGLDFCTYKFRPVDAEQVEAVTKRQKKGKRKKSGRRKR